MRSAFLEPSAEGKWQRERWAPQARCHMSKDLRLTWGKRQLRHVYRCKDLPCNLPCNLLPVAADVVGANLRDTLLLTKIDHVVYKQHYPRAEILFICWTVDSALSTHVDHPNMTFAISKPYQFGAIVDSGSVLIHIMP